MLREHPAPQQFDVLRIGSLAMGGTFLLEDGPYFSRVKLPRSAAVGSNQCPRNWAFDMQTQRSDNELTHFS